MRKNTDQKNSEHGHFSRSVGQVLQTGAIIKRWDSMFLWDQGEWIHDYW